MNQALIFGCGGIGEKCKTYLEELGYEVIAFVDNDKDKWGKLFQGKIIISPKEISSLNYKQIAIGNYKAANSIKRQLLELGVEKDKIIIPFIPNRIFKNESVVISAGLDNVENEQKSDLTLWYKKLGIKILDTELIEKFDGLKSVLKENNIPLSEVCVVSGAVLQVLDLRKSKTFDDIDIIMTSPYRELYGTGLVIVSETCEMHPQNEYDDITDDEIITNPKYHFYYRGLKFIDPKILYKHKLKKGSKEEANLLEVFLKEKGAN